MRCPTNNFTVMVAAIGLLLSLFSARPTVSADFLSQTSGVSSDQLQPYLDKVQNSIKRAWFPAKGQEGKTIVTVFKIHRDGSITDLKVRHSNGSKVGNECAMCAVRNAAPFEKLPTIVGTEIGLQYVFNDVVVSVKKKPLTICEFANHAEDNANAMNKKSLKPVGPSVAGYGSYQHYSHDGWVGDFMPRHQGP